MEWDEDSSYESSDLGRKPRKHKRKKRKHRYESEELGSKHISPPVKIKIKIGGKILSESVVVTPVPVDVDEDAAEDERLSPLTTGSKLTESDEEDAWLDAIEKGELDEYERERQVGRKALTARQKSMREKSKDTCHHSMDDDFVTFPIKGRSKKKLETLETLQKKALKAEKRREQAIEKREKGKKETMVRLLQKQDSKVKQGSQKPVVRTGNRDMRNRVKYIDRLHEKVLCFHSDLPPYLVTEKMRIPAKPPPRVKCGIVGCTNRKKYSCSQSGLPLCSLQCYKLNQKLLVLPT